MWANVAHASYTSVWDAQTQLGPGWLELHLTLGDWVADGLLALFFFVAGLELKRELTVGELADRRSRSSARRCRPLCACCCCRWRSLTTSPRSR